MTAFTRCVLVQLQFMKMDLEDARSTDLQRQIGEQLHRVTEAFATVDASESTVGSVAFTDTFPCVHFPSAHFL